MRQPHVSILAAAGLLVVLLMTGACERTIGDAGTLSPSAPRRIVLVVIDTLRADHIGAYGGYVTTPHLDAFAGQGTLFERAYSHAPITGPSHASMFTGLLPVDHKVEANAQIVADEVEMLAERLNELGFATGAFVSLGVMGSQWGFAQGFDTYDEEFAGQWFRPGSEIRRRAVEWIGSSDDERAFLWVHFSDPHEPYSPPDEAYPLFNVVFDGRVHGTVEANGYSWNVPVTFPPGDHEIVFRPQGPPATKRVVFRSIHETGGNAQLTLGPGWAEEEGTAPIWKNVASLPAVIRVRNPLQRAIQTNLRFFCHEDLNLEQIRSRYRQEVEYVDRQFGRLIDGLREHGWWDDSLIILTSDHGEGLGDHQLIGHIEQLYDTLLRVPLIVVAPGRVRPGKVDAVVRHVDIAATIYDFLGLGDRHGRGSSLLPLINEGVESRRRTAVSMTARPTATVDRRSLVLGPFKYINTLPNGPEELYDLLADPKELEDLAQKDGDRLEQMRLRLSVLLEPLRGSGPNAVQPAELDEEQTRQLKALGYVN